MLRKHYSGNKADRERQAKVKTPLLYVLHSGNLYGTERMALATAEGLREDFAPVIFAPPGPALAEALRMGMQAIPFRNPLELMVRMVPFFWKERSFSFLATGVSHSLLCLTLNLIFRRSVRHLHMVHGGTDERLSYGRKRKLNNKDVTFVAVSDFVRNKLIEHGVNPGQVTVIENFLTGSNPDRLPSRGPFQGKVKNLVVVSRLDPIKRVELLLEAMTEASDLRDMPVKIFGTGWDEEQLKLRAAADTPNIRFMGFTPEVLREISESDLLVHLCSEEPFGLAILESISVGVPVLVPDAGGAGSIVEDGVTGFRFRANQVQSLIEKLREIQKVEPSDLNRLVERALGLLQTRFSPANRLLDYRRLLLEETHVPRN